MRHYKLFLVLLASVALLVGAFSTALAQAPTPTTEPVFLLFTTYPSQTIGLSESANLPLKIRSTYPAQTVRLELLEAPEGWAVNFRGSGRNVQSVFVDPNADASVELRIEPPANVQPGAYRFVVAAVGQQARSELPIELTVREKAPARMSLKTNDLPTQHGTPATTYRWSLQLKNEGDEDLSVNLIAAAPTGFQSSFRYSGQEVSNLPLGANETKSVSLEVKPFVEIPAGAYPIAVQAQAGDLSADLEVMAEVSGQPQLVVTAPDGRLSGRATAGTESTLKIILQNTGTAPARGVELSSTEPTGWSVSFDPKRIDEIAAGKQVEVTAAIRSSEKALAGDYIVVVRAQPQDNAAKSAEFRITVTTSTLWGLAGVGLIAAAVVAAGAVVVRFGRR